MTVKDYIEPAKLLFDLYSTYDNDNNLMKSDEWQQFLSYARQIKQAGHENQFIEFIEMLWAD